MVGNGSGQVLADQLGFIADLPYRWRIFTEMRAGLSAALLWDDRDAAVTF